MSENPQTTLVLGGPGKTGRQVADLLTEAGRRVRIGPPGGRPRSDRDDPATDVKGDR